MRLTFYTGASHGHSDGYAQEVSRVAEATAAQGHSVVYGGGSVGLMGVLARSAVDAGAEVIGVMPQVLADHEGLESSVVELEIVPDMHSRKMRMMHLGDAFIALPGGAGTLEELFEVWTWQQLGIHTKPVVLYNFAGFWEPLLNMLNEMVASGFISAQFRDSLLVVSSPEELFRALENFAAPTPRWAEQLPSSTPGPGA